MEKLVETVNAGLKQTVETVNAGLDKGAKSIGAVIDDIQYGQPQEAQMGNQLVDRWGDLVQPIAWCSDDVQQGFFQFQVGIAVANARNRKTTIFHRKSAFSRHTVLFT